MEGEWGEIEKENDLELRLKAREKPKIYLS